MAAGGLYWRYEAQVRKVMRGWVTALLLVAYMVCSICFFTYLYEGYMVSMLLIHPVGVLWGILASILSSPFSFDTHIGLLQFYENSHPAQH